ncbi:MAG: carboxypeptidase M32 [Pseudomonadota bacterium]
MQWVYSPVKSIIAKTGVMKPVLKLPSPNPPDEGPNSKQSADHPCPNYMKLKMRFRDIGRMNAIIETLGRDFLTAMPEGAYKSRLGQISFLYRRMHEDLANHDVVELVENAHKHQQQYPDDWDKWDNANLREMEVMYRHHCRVDPELMERRARLSYEGRRIHRDVMRENDWESGREFLEQMIDLQRTIADSKCLTDNEHHTETAYQALLREYMPGTRIDEIEKFFGEIDTKLKTLLPKILEKQAQRDEPVPLEGPYPPQLQMWLNRSLLKLIGFDFKRGGLYETGHNPVEGGTPDDTRLVIKNVDAANFMESMKSALHEGGHGLYIQGLPRDIWRYQPVGQDMGAAVQESQALLVEMILGRTREYFEYLAPRVEGLFQKFGDPSITPENLYALKRHVKPTSDRKRADEVTYFFHINLRMKLERQLINGELAVKDLPEAWNAELKANLNVEPEGTHHGCLQDVHWFVGKFGYFPSYTLGHMMAAQLHDQMKRDMQDLPQRLRSGDFSSIRKWLNRHVHRKGRLMRRDELLNEVTSAPLSTAPLLNHLEERYLVQA